MCDEPDKIDLQILDLLKQDGRLTNKQISQIVKKSPTAVNVRLSSYLEKGYIERYAVVLDYEKLGSGQKAFIYVNLEDHNAVSIANFEDNVMKFDEVLHCSQTVGKHDYILLVAVKDINALWEFLEKKSYPLIPLAAMKATLLQKRLKKKSDRLPVCKLQLY